MSDKQLINSELQLIEHIRQKFSLNHTSSILGIGDDAAVIDRTDQYGLMTTDMLLEGVHFDLTYMPIQHLGYKAVAVNVSDIAAMNGIPTQITVSLAFSNRFSFEAIDTFYEGVQHACKNYEVDLVGGDTATSRQGLIISVTALGTVPKKNITFRSQAKNHDIICVTGDLGAAYTGLQILEREKEVFLTDPEMQPQLADYEYIVQRQLRPEARMDIIHELRELEVKPTAMIDISDGLASELLHIAKSSEVGIQIFEDKLPIDKLTYETAVALNISPVTCACNGGEDYELLFTIDQKDYEKISKHPDIHLIGYVQEASKGCQLVTSSGTTAPLKAQGWTHFGER